MTNIASRAIFSAITVSAIAGFAMLSQSGAASAKSVTHCEGASRQSVIECCETLVQRKGKPLWMKQTGRNCSSSVVCKGGGKPTFTHVSAPKLCMIKRVERDRDGGNDRPDRGNDNPNGTPGTSGPK
jgi:hypothetical protein